MKIRPRSPWQILIIILIAVISLELIAHLSAEILWFRELGYLSIFLTRLGWQLALLAGVTALSLVFCWRNLTIAQKLSQAPTELKATDPIFTPTVESRFLPLPDFSQALRPAKTRSLKLSVLLPLVISLNFVIAALVIYYSKVAIADWTIDFTLPDLTPPVPSPFDLS